MHLTLTQVTLVQIQDPLPIKEYYVLFYNGKPTFQYEAVENAIQSATLKLRGRALSKPHADRLRESVKLLELCIECAERRSTKASAEDVKDTVLKGLREMIETIEAL